MENEKIKSLFNGFLKSVKENFSEPVVKKFAESKLVDGTTITYEGDVPAIGVPVFVVDETGNQLPAPDGIHKLEDGSSIEVVGGVIAAIGDAEVEAPEATPVPGAMAEPNAPVSPEAQAKRIIESIVKEQVFATASEVTANAQAIEVLTAKVGELIAKIDGVNEKFAKHEKFAADITAVVAEIAKEPQVEVKDEKKEFHAEKQIRKSWMTADPKELNKSIFK